MAGPGVLRAPMRTVSLRNLAAHKVRLVLTLIAVLLGTAFVAGSFIFTDTLKQSFTTIFASSEKGVDSRVQARHDYDPGVPIDLLARIRAVPGARTVQAGITAAVVLVDKHGKAVQTGGAPSQAGAWVTARDSVSPVPTFVSGHAPTRAGEVVVNDGAARQDHLAVGDHVKVVTPGGRVVPTTITGVYQVSFDTGGYLGVLFSPGQAVQLFTDGQHVASIDVAAAPGVSPRTLTDRIARVLPAGLRANTGDEVRRADSDGVASALSFVNYILLGFGLLALLVGTFIIYNTFSMIVAQRQRELALLRAIGANRAQIRRSVLFEAGVIGVLGSALGLAAGIGLAYGLRAVLDALNLGLPSGGLVLGTRTALVSLVLGTAVTLLAARTPARRAATIAPVAAMSEEFAAPNAVSLHRRSVAGAALAAAALAVTVAGVAENSAGTAAALIGVGLLGMCAGAMLLSPVLARWVIAPLGRIVGHPFGMVGQLARTNAIRNPRRTAATAFALTVGLVLVAGVAVLGSSAKASVAKLVNTSVRADYILTTRVSVGVPQAAVAAARKLDGVGSITELHELSASVDGKHYFGDAVDGPLSDAVDLHLEQGSPAISADTMLVSHQTAAQRGWKLGSTHTFSVPGEAPITRKITGSYSDNQLMGPWLVGGDVYRALTPASQRTDIVALLHASPGANLSALRTGLERVTNRYYVVDVQSRSEFEGQVASQINGLIGLLYGLLGLAIVIAILGIINTLALSVIERRREVGMLRAIGMQRTQVRRTIYLESLFIAVFGAVLGLALGLTYGALLTNALSDQGLDVLSVPWAQSVGFLVVAAIIGVLAAVWPGIRAARTRPLAAIGAA